MQGFRVMSPGIVWCLPCVAEAARKVFQSEGAAR